MQVPYYDRFMRLRRQLIFGMTGIHWHAGCTKGTDNGKAYANLIAAFQEVLSSARTCRARHSRVNSLSPHYGGTADTDLKVEKEDNTIDSKRALWEDTEAPSLSRLPLLIWRETLPQHFPTSNGGYPLGQKFVGE